MIGTPREKDTTDDKRQEATNCNLERFRQEAKTLENSWKKDEKINKPGIVTTSDNRKRRESTLSIAKRATSFNRLYEAVSFIKRIALLQWRFANL